MSDEFCVPGRRAVTIIGVFSVVCWLAIILPRFADAVVFESRTFNSDSEAERYRTLIAELRCLVCQNQNLADSDAGLAADLRNEVHAMIVDGASDQDIVDFMVARYGDFVLYRPPIKATTVALWGAPLILTVIGLVLLVRVIRNGRGSQAKPLSEAQRQQLNELLVTRNDTAQRVDQERAS